MGAMLKTYAEEGFDSKLKQLYDCFTAIILNLLSIFVKTQANIIPVGCAMRTLDRIRCALRTLHGDR